MENKTKILSFSLLAFVVGIFLTFIVIFFSAESIMMVEHEARYDFDKTVEEFEKEVLAAGWKIPTVHDLQATMKKFEKDVDKIKVFEICKADHAYEILSRDNERLVSSLMPCRVAIYEKSNGQVYISSMNTGIMGSMMSGVVPEVMKMASSESGEIVSKLIKE